MIFCLIAKSLHARDSLWIRQTYCMFFQTYCMFNELIVCSSNLWFVKFLIRISFVNIYVFVSSIEINYLCLLIEMRLVRDRILVMNYSYEYIENSILVINNRIDWFLRLDVLETSYDEEILHWRMSKSNLIDIFTLIFDKCIQSNFTKRLIQINF